MRNIKGKIFKKVVSVVLIVLILTIDTVSISAQETGSCGNGVNWSFSNGILKVEGNGKMKDFDNPSSVPWYEFKDQIVSIIIENEVDSIGNSAFYDCNNLGSVIIGNDVESIGISAFLECEKLTNVRVGSKVKSIGQHAFKMCTSLESIILPQGVESIGHEAFFLCQSLGSITIPSSVTFLGESVFAYCDSLLQVNFNAKLDKLPDWTFYDCDSLVNVILPDTMEEIGVDAFAGCDKLDAISGNISEGVTDVINSQINSNVNITENDDETVLIQPDSDTFQHEVVENENVVINGHISDSNITINATVSDKQGWEELIDKIDSYQNVQDEWDYEEPINVNIMVYNDLKVSGELLESLAGTNTILVIQGDNIEYQINCKDLVIGKKYRDFKLDYSFEKISKYSKSITETIGEAEGYYLKFKANIDFNITVKLLLGAEHVFDIAALYEKDGDWALLQSVTIDNEGYASFYLGSFDSFTKYLIGINVEGVESGILPDSLYDDYDGLMDAYGNRYVITGRTSAWGITAGQLTLILTGIIVAVVATVGGVMFMIHKRKLANERIRKEVMSEKRINKKD